MCSPGLPKALLETLSGRPVDDETLVKGETIEAARRRLALRFRESGIDSADVDARLLVCAAAEIDHAKAISDPTHLLDPSAACRLESFAARRLKREPVSRILGRREFWGLDFAVSAAVLDPRPETEGLVASALDAIGGRRSAPLRMLDLGVGSGAILGALLKELPLAWGVGVDRSEPACCIARANLDRLGMATRASILCSDWASALTARFDLVVSNPPYVVSGELAGLEREVREYDPIDALHGGGDGLDAYRTIVPSLTLVLKPDGIACLECGTAQGARVVALMEESGLCGATIYKDLGGHDRVLVARYAC